VPIFNDKFDVVAGHHLRTTGNTEQFHHWVLMSVEQNCNGVDNVDLEFHKPFFEHSMFETDGAGCRGADRRPDLRRSGLRQPPGLRSAIDRTPHVRAALLR
jgi:hypothetical protein